MNHGILLAVRPGESAGATLDAAAWLARGLGARVTLIYVAVELETAPTVASGAGLDPDHARERMLSEVRQRLEGMVAGHLAGLQVTILIEEGDVVDRIAEAAVRTEAQLLVVGTHGRTGASRLIVGDIADAVLRAAPCPVVVVPRPRDGAET